MKTVIIYYSMSGNVKYVANEIKKELDADIIEIKPRRAYPKKGFKKYFWGGKAAVMGETPKLMPYKFQADDYDRIIIGTPVWAGRFTPPIRTFITENRDIAGKRISVFTCFSGSGADKAIEKLRNFIGIKRFEAKLILVDPIIKIKSENDAKIKSFCSKLS